MSEVKDPKKGEETETTGKDSEKPPKKDDDVEIAEKTRKVTHRVEISRNPEIDSLQKELVEKTKALEKAEAEKQELITSKEEVDEKLTEFEAEKEKEALEKFTTDKADIIKLCKDSGLEEEKIEEIETMLDGPKKLEMVKSFTTMLISALPQNPKEGDKTGGISDGKKPPKPATKGKAPMVPPATDTQHEDANKMIDEIYTIIKDPTGRYTPEQKAEANKKRLMMWNSLIQGKSIKQLLAGAPIGARQTMACPSCAGTITGDKIPESCPHCGYDLGRVPSDRKSTRGAVRTG